MLLFLLAACAHAPERSPSSVPRAVPPPAVRPPELHVRCFEGVSGRPAHNACTLSYEGVSIVLDAVQVLPVCAARGGTPPRVIGGWPRGAADWSPSCYGAGDAFLCTLLVEATGPAAGAPSDVLVLWGGQAGALEPDALPTPTVPLAPFPTRPDADLDARGGVEVFAWPRRLGGPVSVDASCAGGDPLP